MLNQYVYGCEKAKLLSQKLLIRYFILNPLLFQRLVLDWNITIILYSQLMGQNVSCPTYPKSVKLKNIFKDSYG